MTYDQSGKTLRMGSSNCPLQS